jgi:hypothetical protein
MSNIGFELHRPDRNWLQKLWAILKFGIVAVFFAWWLATSLLAALAVYAFGLVAYHGELVAVAGHALRAGWYFIGAAVFLYCFSVRPFLRGGPFRK